MRTANIIPSAAGTSIKVHTVLIIPIIWYSTPIGITGITKLKRIKRNKLGNIIRHFAGKNVTNCYKFNIFRDLS